MGKISRHEERYLALFEREHQLMKDEDFIQKIFDEQEQLEEEAFVEFQTARSKSLAEEKKYAAITKYRAIIGSLLTFIFGSFGQFLVLISMGSIAYYISRLSV